MKMINWAELTDLASPEMLIFASSEVEKLKNRVRDIYYTIFRIFSSLSLRIGFKIEGWYPDKIIILSWLPSSYLDWNLTVVGPSFLPTLADKIEYIIVKNFNHPEMSQTLVANIAIFFYYIRRREIHKSKTVICKKKSNLVQYFLNQNLCCADTSVSLE